jgi:hypothetical protein
MEERFHDNGVSYGAACIAPGKDFNWTLREFLGQEPAVTDNSPLAKKIAGELRARRINHGYAPSVTAMNANILSVGDLRSGIILPGGERIYRQNDMPGDAIPVNEGSAFMMSAGGCPVIIATGKAKTGDKLCIVAHAGRDSLLDRRLVEMGERSRRTESVVFEIARFAKRHGVCPKGMTLRVLFQMDPRCFAHELGNKQYAFYNTNLVSAAKRYHEQACDVRGNVAYLDLGWLIYGQAQVAGFGNVFTAHPLPYDGVFGHTRHPNPHLRKMNLVLVYRT